MNKRLKQLGDQAGVCPIKHVGGGEWDSYLPEAEQKFAELIVRECAELSVNSQYSNTKSEYYEGFNEALIYAGNKIKQHFGVKE